MLLGFLGTSVIELTKWLRIDDIANMSNCLVFLNHEHGIDVGSNMENDYCKDCHIQGTTLVENGKSEHLYHSSTCNPFSNGISLGGPNLTRSAVC
jgi:hypothetical protein